jgi:hypothetical protein
VKRRRRPTRAALARHLQDTYARGKTPTREKAQTDALPRAEANVSEPWAVRIDALRRAATHADAEARAFVSDHHLALLEGELRPESEAAQGRVETALGELRAALRAWQDAASGVTALVRDVPDVNGQDVSTFPGAGDLIRAAGEVGDVPLPYVKPGIVGWMQQGRPQQPPMVERLNV